MELQDGVLRLGVDFRYLAWWHDFLDVSSFFLNAFALWHSNSLLAYFWKKTNTALIQHRKVCFMESLKACQVTLFWKVKSHLSFTLQVEPLLAGYLSLWKMSNVPNASCLFPRILRHLVLYGHFLLWFPSIGNWLYHLNFFCLTVPFRLSFPFLSPFVSFIILCFFTFE